MNLPQWFPMSSPNIFQKKKKFQKKLFATVCHNVEIMPYVWSGLPEQYMIRFKIWMLKL